MAVLDGGRGRVEWMGSTVLPEPSSEITLIIMPYDPRVFILSIDLMLLACSGFTSSPLILCCGSPTWLAGLLGCRTLVSPFHSCLSLVKQYPSLVLLLIAATIVLSGRGHLTTATLLPWYVPPY